MSSFFVFFRFLSFRIYLVRFQLLHANCAWSELADFFVGCALAVMQFAWISFQLSATSNWRNLHCFKTDRNLKYVFSDLKSLNFCLNLFNLSHKWQFSISTTTFVLFCVKLIWSAVYRMKKSCFGTLINTLNILPFFHFMSTINLDRMDYINKIFFHGVNRISMKLCNY